MIADYVAPNGMVRYSQYIIPQGSVLAWLYPFLTAYNDIGHIGPRFTKHFVSHLGR